MIDSPQHTGGDLSPEEKRALLEHRLREKAGQSVTEHRLSYGQRALWFIYQIASESSAYHIAITQWINSNLDIEALERTFQYLANRHPLLRSTYHQRDDDVVQVFQPNQEVSFVQVDAARWDEAELHAQILMAYERPFDLERGPVLRIHVYTLAPEKHVLLVVVHHIAFDGYSCVIFSRELLEVYEAELAGRAPALPPISATYDDFVARQIDILGSPEGDRLKAYWLAQLSGELPTLNLPTDFPRPPVQTYNGASYKFEFDRDHVKQLKSFASSEGVTLYVLMLAVFQVLLHRYSGQDDVLIGSPTSIRDHMLFDNTIGYFVDPVVLRSKAEDNPSFRSVLNQARSTVLGAISHQAYPFIRLVENLSLPNDPSRSPIFQVLFNLLSTLRSDATLEAYAISQASEAYPLTQEEGQFDLAMDAFEVGGVLNCWLKYNTDLYQESTIVRMAGHYQAILDSVMRDPDIKLFEIPLLSAAEREQVLVGWNDTGVDYPTDKCIHELIEAQVDRSPHAVAVVFEDGQLSYAQLNQRANQLAAYLHAAGAAPDKPIGLYVERSLEMTVALLAILKAGAAYLPLDPTYPKDRIAYMLEDAQVDLIITQARLENMLPEHQARAIRIDADWESISQYPDTNPETNTTPENLSYIIYTSGSTGRPKGVMIEHRSVVNFFTGMDVCIHYDLPATWLAVTSLSFDISVLEIFWTLARGFKLVIYADTSHQLDAASLDQAQDYSVAALISRHTVTHLQCTPSMASMLLDDERNHQALAQLEQVIIGGEAFPMALAEALIQLGLGNIVNVYGPTEATIWSLAHPLGDEVNSIPIGRPIANTSVYILDKYGQPVPVGIAGELFIGGSGLARGYLNRPDLTKQRFIADPFSQALGARLYRTGDLARYRADGCIEFLGRIDHQVKIRGYRIELGEIEALLDEQPNVNQSVVTVREDVPGDKMLTAYVVVKPGATFVAADARQYLRERLPEFMVPSHYVTLDKFPLTPNAKVDRKALPPPEVTRAPTIAMRAVPTRPMEITLAEIWRRVLNVDEVGTLDNFFDLGGHSLQTMRVVNQLKSATGVRLDPVRMRFETLGQLATYCEMLATSEPDAREGSGLPQKLLSSMRRFISTKRNSDDSG